MLGLLMGLLMVLPVGLLVGSVLGPVLGRLPGVALAAVSGVLPGSAFAVPVISGGCGTPGAPMLFNAGDLFAWGAARRAGDRAGGAVLAPRPPKSAGAVAVWRQN